MEAYSLPEPLKRLVLALTLSVALHFALIFLVRLVPSPTAPARNIVLEVQLEQAPSKVQSLAMLHPVAQDKPDIPAVEPQATPPKPQPQPQPEPPTPAASSVPQPAATQSPLPTLEVPMLEDPTYYPAKQLDVQPKALAPIQPVYPEKADQENISGQVTLILLIDERGIVHDIGIVDAKPEGYFEESAVNAFRDSRWEPARKDGRIVKSRVLIRVRYEAGGKVGF